MPALPNQENPSPAESTTPAWYRPPSGAGNGSPKAAPFARGNTQRLVAGHRSPRVYGEVSKALAAELAEARPDLAAYPEALASWADAEARAALLRAHLDTHGTIDPASGELRQSLLSALDRFERRAAAARSQLGLDPRSEAELALLRAKAMNEGALAPKVTLEALAAQGRTALEASPDPVQAALDQVREAPAQPAPRASQQPTDGPQTAEHTSNHLNHEGAPE